jgi:formamidopyrimidine-DNA glycosylase
VPELLEIEANRVLAATAVGRVIAAVDAPDPWWLKEGATAELLAGALVGATLAGARRRGKLLLLDTVFEGAGAGGAPGPTLGLRFGMTGRLVLDGRATDALLYSADQDLAAGRPEWDRFALHFTDGTRMAVRDPRRLGGALLDPDEERLGPDATIVTRAQLGAALVSRAPLKAALMDQERIAGLGNLLVDEVLWRAGLDPARPARSLTKADLATLHRAMRQMLRTLGRRGGSHTGDFGPARAPGGRCPRDGTPLERRTIGGRTTFSCPAHQV